MLLLHKLSHNFLALNYFWFSHYSQVVFHSARSPTCIRGVFCCEGEDMLYFKVSLIQLLHGQWLARMKAIFVAWTTEKQLRFRGKLFGSCCSWEAGSVCLCRTPGRPFWLHMCLSILWNRALRASRNTHTLPQTIQGHKHFPIFPQKNSPCPCLAEKLKFSSKGSSAQITS